MKDSQQEDTIRELATTLVVRPNQVVALGSIPEPGRSLGHFLFTEDEANSDRVLQKVLIVWASQGQLEPLVTAQPLAGTSSAPANAAEGTKDKEAKGKK
jgi:hypothetical protein